MAASIALAINASAASAAVRISDDRGGQVGPYIATFKKLRTSGEKVIDGDCLSACTLLLGIVPRDRICVTPRARFGFHMAWTPWLAGIHQYNKAGTELLLATYPSDIRGWIASKGGLSNETLYLSGAELRIFYSECR